MGHTNDRHTLLIRYLQSGQASRAYETCQQILQDDPENAHFLQVMGQCCLSLKRYPEALRYLEQSLAIDPENPIAYYTLAAVHFRQRKFKQAKDYARKAVELDPDDADYWGMLGNCCHSLKEYQNAKVYAAKALEIAPNDPHHINLEAIIDEDLDENSRTPATAKLARYQRALEFDPENAYCLNNLATVYLNDLKEYEKAEKILRQCLHINPNEPLFKKNLLLCLRRQDLLLRFLYFPFELIVLKIARFFQWCWEVKWAVILLIFTAKYLLIIVIAFFLLWCIFFYPLIAAYRWMTMREIRMKAGDLTGHTPVLLRRFYRLSFRVRMLLFTLLWACLWTATSRAFARNEVISAFGIALAICFFGMIIYSWSSLIWKQIRKHRQKREHENLKKTLNSP